MFVACFICSFFWVNLRLKIAMCSDIFRLFYFFLAFFICSPTLLLLCEPPHRNARELVDYPCEIKIPRRVIQLEFFRWGFAISYAIIAGLATSILISVSPAADAHQWIGNLILDIILVVIFLVYARNAHNHNVSVCC